MSYSRKPKRGVKGSSSGGKAKPGGDGSSSARARDSQAGARVRMPDEHKPKVSQPGDTHEREAEAVAERVAAGGKAGPISSMHTSVGRAVTPAAEEKKEAVARATKPEEEKEAVARAAEPEEEPEKEKEPVARAGAPEEEKEPVARVPAPEEEKEPVARAAAPEKEEEPVARQAAGPKEEEKPPLQRLASRAAAATDEKRPPARAPAGGQGGSTPASASHHVAQDAISSPGPGSPLEPSTRAALGPRMGMDLDSVRVHDDRKSHEAAAALHARAFTRGNDIWLGRGESQRDIRLMAHEVTHVAQQKGGVNRSIQRQKKGKGKATPVVPKVDGDTVTVPGTGCIDASGKRIRLEKVRVPRWKVEAMQQTTDVALRKEERDSKQTEVWDKEVRPEIGAAMKAKLEASDVMTDKADRRIYFLEYKGKGGYLLGSLAAIKQRAGRPEWDSKGKPHFYDVEHKQDWLFGGLDVKSNLWLVDAHANQDAGSRTSKEISDEINELLTAVPKDLQDKVPKDAKQARADYTITIEAFTSGLPEAGDPSATWDVSAIEMGKPVDALSVLSKKEAEKRDLIGPDVDSRLIIFTAATGGASVTIPWKDGKPAKGKKGPWPLYKHFNVDKVTWDGTAGTIEGTGFKDNPFLDPIAVSLDLAAHSAIEQAAYVRGRDIESKLRDLKLKGLSPIQIEFAEMRDPKGIYMRGKVLPDVPLIAGAGVDLVVDGDDVYLEKVFSTADFKFPGPVQVKQASLALAAGTVGLRVSGQVLFEIPRVGKGHIGARATAAEKGGFDLEGQFDFDPGLFDPAQIKVWYRDRKFGASGEIGVPKGKVRGLKSANVKVTFEEERIDAKGTFEPDIKGVQSGDLSITYDEAAGLQIAGTLQLSNEVPGLKSGTIEASVKQKGEAWSLGGAITAEAGIPGITATVTGSYEDGGWQVEGTAGYEKGFLKGSVTVGATNRPVGEDGRPAGEGTSKLSAYGGGQVTIKLAPWLQGTVGLKVQPDGNLIVSGKVALPSAFELFPEKKLEKNIFSINIDIPIVGFTVLGQRVGIFATIGGGLDAEAGIGPGELRQAELGVTYNPADEAATVVTGAAQLFIPAKAGLRLFVKGGIGAGIPLVSATAGLELGGRLGIEAALQSDLQVDWTPAKGLVLDTVLQAYAQPKFKFDITGFVDVTVDYFFGSSTLYEKKWELAAVEYGSDLRFGLKLPIRYEEGKAFDVSLSDVEFEYPQIEPMELLTGLVRKIA